MVIEIIATEDEKDCYGDFDESFIGFGILAKQITALRQLLKCLRKKK